MSISRDDFSQKLDSIYKNLKNDLLYFHGKDNDYAESMLSWFAEVSIKNKMIHRFKNIKEKKDKEMARRRRSSVYFIDFGVNVGSEFNSPHFGVVIAEHTFTAVIVPLSSKKDTDKGGWKDDPLSSIIDIGAISGFDENAPDCYALISQIRTISKQRLSDFKDKDGMFKNLSLTSKQMDLIDAEIINSFTDPNKVK